MSLVEQYSNIISLILLSNYLLLVLFSVVPIKYKEEAVVISPWAHHYDKLARK